MQQNILTEAYHQGLTYVAYNGPPDTIWARYQGDYWSECGIIHVLKTCGADLFEHIINPSEAVQVAAVTLAPRLLDKIEQPSTAVLLAYFKQRSTWFEKYRARLTEDDLLTLLPYNPELYLKIVEPTEQMTEIAVTNQPDLIKSVKVQSPQLCALAVQKIYVKPFTRMHENWLPFVGLVAAAKLTEEELAQNLPIDLVKFAGKN